MTDQDLRSRIRALYADYLRDGPEPVYAALHPAVVWRSLGVPYLPWSGEWRGAEGVAAYFKEIGEAVELLDFTVEEILVQDDLAVVLGEVRLRWRGSGATETYEKADVLRLRDGQIVEFREFYDTAAAATACRAL